jgi:hypothetical protein
MVLEVAVPNAECNLEENGGMSVDVTGTLSPKGSDRQVNNHTLLLDTPEAQASSENMIHDTGTRAADE